MAELDGVIHEIVEYLLDFDHVRVDVHLVSGEDKLNGNQPLAAGSLKGHCRVFDDLVDVKIAPVENHALGRQVVEREQGVGQFGQAVCLVQDDADIFLVHLGGDRAVEHRLEISAHGGERRTEIVGDVCYKALLIVLALGDLACHIGEGGGEVADLVLAVELKFIPEVADGVLLSRVCDLAERQIHHLREEEQYDQRQQKEDHQRDIGYVQERIAGGLQVFHGCVDDHVTLHLVFGGDRRKRRDHFLIEHPKKIPGRVK